MSNQLESHN